MFRIEEPAYLYLWLIIPVVWVLFVFIRLQSNRKLQRYVDVSAQKKIIKEKSVIKPYVKLFWWTLTWFFMVLALANPQMGSQTETVRRQGADIVFALDVSKSMLAEDVKPNRLTKAKQIVSKTIDHLVSDRIGIVIFAGEAYPVLPITTDYATAKLYLQNINTDMVSGQGTALDEAIRLAGTYFDRDQADKILVIISDGEDFGEDATAAAEEVAEKGIKIFTIGVGTEKGSLIPIRVNNQLRGYKKDRSGKRVITRRNQTLLFQLAKQTGGIYLDGNNTFEAFKKLNDYLKGLNREEYETKKITRYKDRFQWPVGMAVLMFLLYLFTNEKETRWLKKWELFNEKEN